VSRYVLSWGMPGTPPVKVVGSPTSCSTKDANPNGLPDRSRPLKAFTGWPMAKPHKTHLPVVQHSPSFTPPFSNEADASSESKPLEFEGFDVRENRLDHVHFRTCPFHVAVALLPAAATCVGGQRNMGLKSPGFRRRAKTWPNCDSTEFPRLYSPQIGTCP
jgi:hypothetical protein